MTGPEEDFEFRKVLDAGGPGEKIVIVRKVRIEEVNKGALLHPRLEKWLDSLAGRVSEYLVRKGVSRETAGGVSRVVWGLLLSGLLLSMLAVPFFVVTYSLVISGKEWLPISVFLSAIQYLSTRDYSKTYSGLSLLASVVIMLAFAFRTVSGLGPDVGMFFSFVMIGYVMLGALSWDPSSPGYYKKVFTFCSYALNAFLLSVSVYLFFAGA